MYVLHFFPSLESQQLTFIISLQNFFFLLLSHVVNVTPTPSNNDINLDMSFSFTLLHQNPHPKHISHITSLQLPTVLHVCQCCL